MKSNRIMMSGLVVAAIAAGAIGVWSQIEKVEAGSLTAIAGSEWGYAGQDKPFVRFGSDGQVSGDGGCNRFTGMYKQDGDKLEIGPLASTRRACIGDLMEKETAFLKALQATSTFDATHLTLKLNGGDGTTLLDLKRRDAD